MNQTNNRRPITFRDELAARLKQKARCGKQAASDTQRKGVLLRDGLPISEEHQPENAQQRQEGKSQSSQAATPTLQGEPSHRL